jgi:hypothetical protein
MATPAPRLYRTVSVAAAPSAAALLSPFRLLLDLRDVRKAQCQGSSRQGRSVLSLWIDGYSTNSVAAALVDSAHNWSGLCYHDANGRVVGGVVGELRYRIGGAALIVVVDSRENDKNNPIKNTLFTPRTLET